MKSFPLLSGSGKSEPASHDLVHAAYLVGSQHDNFPHEASLTDRSEVLNIEGALLQAAQPKRNLEACPAHRGGVWNYCVKSALILHKGNAVNQGWPDLGCETKINLPDFTPLRLGHGCALPRRGPEIAPKRSRPSPPPSTARARSV